MVSSVRRLAHLLLGYDMEAALAGRVDESLLLPSHEYSCLTIVERLLTQHGMRCAAPAVRAPWRAVPSGSATLHSLA